MGVWAQVLRLWCVLALVSQCAAVYKVAVFSGGGIRAAFATVIALDMLDGVVDWDEIHALSGGAWGVALKNIGGQHAFNFMCPRFKYALRKSDGRGDLLGPAATLSDLSNYHFWEDEVADFTLGDPTCPYATPVQGPYWPSVYPAECPNQQELRRTFTTYPSAHLHATKVFFHTAVLKKWKKKIIPGIGPTTEAYKRTNDCWWTNQPNEEFGCLFNPIRPVSPSFPHQHLSSTSRFSTRDEHTNALRALTITSAAHTTLQTPSLVREEPIPYYMAEDRVAGSILGGTRRLMLTDGGDYLNIPIASTLQEYARCGKETTVYVFDNGAPTPIIGKYYDMNSILNEGDRSLEALATVFNLVLTQGNYRYTAQTGNCRKDLKYAPPAIPDPSCTAGPTGPLIVRIFGICGADAHGTVDNTLSVRFPTVQIPKGEGAAFQWDEQEATDLSQNYARFLKAELTLKLATAGAYDCAGHSITVNACTHNVLYDAPSPPPSAELWQCLYQDAKVVESNHKKNLAGNFLLAETAESNDAISEQLSTMEAQIEQ